MRESEVTEALNSGKLVTNSYLVTMLNALHSFRIEVFATYVWFVSSEEIACLQRYRAASFYKTGKKIEFNRETGDNGVPSFMMLGYGSDEERWICPDFRIGPRAIEVLIVDGSEYYKQGVVYNRTTDLRITSRLLDKNPEPYELLEVPSGEIWYEKEERKVPGHAT